MTQSISDVNPNIAHLKSCFACLSPYHVLQHEPGKCIIHFVETDERFFLTTANLDQVIVLVPAQVLYDLMWALGTTEENARSARESFKEKLGDELLMYNEGTLSLGEFAGVITHRGYFLTGLTKDKGDHLCLDIGFLPDPDNVLKQVHFNVYALISNYNPINIS